MNDELKQIQEQIRGKSLEEMAHAQQLMQASLLSPNRHFPLGK